MTICPWPRPHRRTSMLWLMAAAMLAATACGKKGPPLPPLVQLPDRMMDIAARRLGDTIYVRFTVPSANIDGTKPADLSHVDVYAYTAIEAAEGRDLKRITRIATIPVAPPPRPEEAEAREKDAEPAKPAKPAVSQGDVVAVSEKVDDAMRVPLPPDPKLRKPPVKPQPKPAFETPLPLPFPEPQPARFYVAVGVNHKGQRGGLSPRPAVRLSEAPPAPDAPVATVTEPAVVLTWKPPATLRPPYLSLGATARTGVEALVLGLLMRLPLPPPLTSTVKGMPPEPVFTYNVYRLPDPASGPSAPAVPLVPGLVDVPTPLGTAPTASTTYSDPIVAWGRSQCYGVRTVETDATLVVESDLSPLTCVTPQDTFPPPAPAQLAAVASQGAVSLIWDRVTAADLAGYIVFRGPAPDGPLEPLFETPIRENTFRDTTARPGVRYVYEVVAVDSAETPNRSVPSNRVIESAR